MAGERDTIELTHSHCARGFLALKARRRAESSHGAGQFTPVDKTEGSAWPDRHSTKGQVNAVNTSHYIHKLFASTPLSVECVYVGNLNRWKKEAGAGGVVESRLSTRQRKEEAEGRKLSERLESTRPTIGHSSLTQRVLYNQIFKRINADGRDVPVCPRWEMAR
ncbi:hypothetical protein K0M31_013905 [Melipona bicolor]|uniref:Uncharacterized protein n=1 Tax=Melipona bicolor TaxID=60889 RepID=A0AA40G7J0_9HYME|nr:hypothetical protein K0M31_013905 [Melipona bicolor]